jgi:hypothetical protein
MSCGRIVTTWQLLFFKFNEHSLEPIPISYHNINKWEIIC